MSYQIIPTINIDHYIGRKVTKIVQGDGGEGNPLWSLQLEGGVTIHNYSEYTPLPPAGIQGMIFIAAILGETTQMAIGISPNNQQYVVQFMPLDYAIADPGYPELGIVFPQRSEANDPNLLNRPEDPSPRRVRDFRDDETTADDEG